jgi:hypothetical protein
MERMKKLASVLGLGGLRPSRVWGLSCLTIGLLAPGIADAQTWVGTRTTPALTELVTIDATGEPGWLYGAEDVVGDGLNNFKQQEKSIDIRTGYAATDAQSFWVRVYVSDEAAAGGNVTVFVFVDSDRNTTTGGTAAAMEIDPAFTTDASPGGYDYVVGIRGNGSIAQIWEWMAAQSLYVGTMPTAAQARAEVDQDIDPIQINIAAHGYLQAVIDLTLLDLTQACDANLYLRSVNAAASVTGGDFEVGVVGPCIPADANDDDVPDILVPTVPCTADDQCPSDGICVAGTCAIPEPCMTDADCPPDEVCGPNGYCVEVGGGTCSSPADCGDLICTGGVCGPCTPGGTDCGTGFRCTPSGNCISDPGSTSGGLDPGEVQGGAFTCKASSTTATGASIGGWLLLGLGLAATTLRRIQRRMRRTTTNRN